ncbi:tetratricopeptide repeat protein [Schleiferiaceae bacterium]|jgi:tetratricopeptide (TPR) repeat protein|nr:tetratricopeptide repeat protein [Schleiferiaceae bacterium]
MAKFLFISLGLWTLLACTNTGENTSDPAAAITVQGDSLNAYIADHPNDVDALALRARRYMDGANLPYALADAQAILELDSTHHDGWLIYGECNYLTNNSRESKDAWIRCIDEHPEEVDCRLKLAELYSVIMDYDKSLSIVNKVIELNPSEPIAYFIKGLNIRDGKGDSSIALSYIQKAIDLNPNYEAALDMAGVMTAAQGNPLALSYYNRLIELQPENARTYYKVGMFYLGASNFNGAIEAFTKCVQLDPTDAEAFYNLGYIHLELNLLSEARKYFTASIQAREINYRAFYGRAFTWERGGDAANAEKDYRQALTLNPQHGPSREGLNRVLKQK